MNHPPVITIFIGGMFTKGGLLLFYPHCWEYNDKWDNILYKVMRLNGIIMGYITINNRDFSWDLMGDILQTGMVM